MNKVKRTLNEINSEIKTHEEAIKSLRKEIEIFRSECPHPTNFLKIVHSTTEDEYGRIDGGYTVTTCLLCGNSEHKED